MKDFINRVRIGRAIMFHLNPMLLEILEGELPKNKTELYKEMQNLKKKVGGRRLSETQWKVLCGESNYKEWKDTTSIIFVIRNYLNHEHFDWTNNEEEAMKDTSKLGYVNRARILRNKICHPAEDFSKNEIFEAAWKELEDILVGSNYKKMSEFNKLKTQPLDIDAEKEIKELRTKLNNLETYISGKHFKKSFKSFLIVVKQNKIIKLLQFLRFTSYELLYLEGRHN